MGIISNLLGTGTISRELAVASVGEPISIKVTPEVVRVDPQELEQAYVSDAIYFNSINKSTQMIMAAGYNLIDDTNDYFKNFMENIGGIGEDITFNELFEAIFKFQMIYGNAYVELVFDKKTQKKVVDLTLIDPKRVDFAMNGSNKIVTDEHGKPVGYTLKVPWGYDIIGKSDPIPKKYEGKVSLNSNQIFMLPHRICHFKLYTYGDRFYGLGLIEPSYKSALYKKNIEEAQANSIYQRGQYPVIAYVGDEQHEPTPQDIQTVLDNLIKLKHDRYMAFQYWTKVEPLEVKQSDITQNTLEYLRRNQTASLGMPEAFATGAGEKTNRATLTNQQKFLEFTLYDIVYKTLSTIRKYIFKRICFYNHITKVPNIKWGDIEAEELNDKASRINNYVKSGILNPEEVKSFVLKSEELN